MKGIIMEAEHDKERKNKKSQRSQPCKMFDKRR